MPVKPITPAEVVAAMQGIPDAVIEVFNELIQRHYQDGRAIFKTDQAAELVAKLLGIPEQEVRRGSLLNVADIYRKAGWEVTDNSKNPIQPMGMVGVFIFEKK